MVTTIKAGLSQIRGNTMLVSIAVVTLLWGLASEGFDRLYGAHFITDYNLSEDESIYWFGAFYAIAFLLNIVVLRFVEKNVKVIRGCAIAYKCCVDRNDANFRMDRSFLGSCGDVLGDKCTEKRKLSINEHHYK